MRANDSCNKSKPVFLGQDLALLRRVGLHFPLGMQKCDKKIGHDLFR
jgi:hypothetical protein